MSSRRDFQALLALGVFLLLTLVSPAYADSFARIVRLSQIDGDVQIDRNTASGYDHAIVNMPITQGVALKAGDDGRAEVEFEDGSTLRMAENTAVRFTDLSLLSSGARDSGIRVENGVVYFNIRHQGDDEYRLAFAGQDLKIRRSVHFRLQLTDDEAQLAVFKGELKLEGAETATIKKNETLSIDLRNQDRYVLAKGIGPLDSDDWDRERIQYHDTYASSSHTSIPYSYGRSDLGYYGSWMSYPGYGMLWQPYGVGLNWDPFMDGAWAWYQRSGWMWVSNYPWGWMPYRYGRWMWLSGYGWCWRPGYWTAWQPVPAVVDPPPAWHAPAAPAPPGPGRPTTVIVRGPNPNLPDTPRGRWVTDDDARPVRPNRRDLPPANSGSATPTSGLSSGSTSAPGTSATPPAMTPAPRPNVGIDRDVDRAAPRGRQMMNDADRPARAMPTPRTSVPAPPPRVAAPPSPAPVRVAPPSAPVSAPSMRGPSAAPAAQSGGSHGSSGARQASPK